MAGCSKRRVDGARQPIVNHYGRHLNASRLATQLISLEQLHERDVVCSATSVSEFIQAVADSNDI